MGKESGFHRQESRLFITDVSKKEERRNPGKLFSLSKLQGFLGKKYRYSPQETLGYVQSLYEKGFVTYPRTNTEYLSENETEKADRLVDRFSGLGFNVTKKRGKNIFDDSKIESHSALLPTEKNILPWRFFLHHTDGVTVKAFLTIPKKHVIF